MAIQKTAMSALICALCVSNGLVGCASDKAQNPVADEVTGFGSVFLPLRTTGASGTVYHLRKAAFEVRNVKDGRLNATLFGDDEFFGNSLRVDLDAGNYTVTLLPGWFIEREGSGGSTGGATGGGTGGATGGNTGGATGGGGFTGGGDPKEPFGNDGATGGTDTKGPTGSSNPDPKEPGAGGTAASPTPKPTAAPAGETGPSGGSGEPVFGGGPVNANLLSEAIQFVPVFPRQDSFVSFVFEVGDNVVPFGPGAINIDFQVKENGVNPPPPPIDACDDPALSRRRSVFETNREATSAITLREAFDAVSGNGGFATKGELLYQEVIDSYASAANGRLPNAVHCGDETTNGQPTLNGFPIRCDRTEVGQFDNLDGWFATAFVNRIDLAPLNGAHCGQQRVIFANTQNGRMFLNLEAQIPNPAPELGILGCAPLAEFWSNLTQISDAKARGVLLRDAFLVGTPQLAAAGFGPFYTADAFTVGSGQIRTNNFNDFVWTLREFKLAQDNGELKALPFPVAESPNGELWNDTSSQPAGDECRQAFIAALDQLVNTDDPAQMSFVIPQACKNSESENNGTENYAFRLSEGSGNFQSQLEAALAGTDLNATQAATRAQFAGSCIGCHIEANGSDLGRGVTGPQANKFVHVDEQFTEPCAFGGDCFSVSPALRDVFLPHRIAVMTNLVDVPQAIECGGEPQPSFDGGVVPVPTTPPRPSAAPVSDAGPGIQVDSGIPAAPNFTASLPSADIPTPELVQLDEQARDVFGEQTLGGQDARVTH